MRLISSSWDAKRASIYKGFIGGHVIKVGRKKFKLPDDIAKTKITQEQNEMTGWRMLLIVFFALTIIGIVLAIPLYFVSKKKRLVMAFKSVSGDTFSVVATTNAETKMLQQYSAVGAFD